MVLNNDSSGATRATYGMTARAASTPDCDRSGCSGCSGCAVAAELEAAFTEPTEDAAFTNSAPDREPAFNPTIADRQAACNLSLSLFISEEFSCATINPQCNFVGGIISGITAFGLVAVTDIVAAKTDLIIFLPPSPPPNLPNLFCLKPPPNFRNLLNLWCLKPPNLWSLISPKL